MNKKIQKWVVLFLKIFGGLVSITWCLIWIAFTFLMFPDFMEWWTGVRERFIEMYSINNSMDFQASFGLAMIDIIPSWFLVTMLTIGFTVIFSLLDSLRARKQNDVEKSH